MNEHELRDLLHQAVPEAPHLDAAAIAARGRTRQRRQLVASGTAVAGVLAVVIGGTTLFGSRPQAPGPDRPGRMATQAAEPAPPGTRLVGIGHAAIAVPEDWATNALRCGTPTRPTVVVDVSAIESCAWTAPKVHDRVWVTRSNRLALAPKVEFEIDGVPAQKSVTSCLPGRRPVCSNGVYIPSEHASFTIASATSAQVEEIISWIRIVPDQVAVPGFSRINDTKQDDDAGAHYREALEAAGLEVEVRTKPVPGSKAGYVLETDPAPGTMLAPGEVVTMTEIAEPSGPAEEVSVEVNSVGPGDSMDYKGRSDAQLRAGTTIRLELGSTIWVYGHGKRISTLAGEVAGDALTLDDWKEGPNYGRSWKAIRRGTSTLTVSITAGGERVVIGRVAVIVR
ncbi:PASTA domain-containing protein [Nocardioides daejeonensis]|uniref:PASTA domain-containing protein n=1 Tax=Nocardioides daejeonensis TaxID=1046556 RepID=UPI000D74503B|nr:PASTA domain-containing protein [Nocardioides daejeonensis]